MHSLALLAAALFLQSNEAELNADIEKMRSDASVPGVAIVVSKSGKIIYGRGFGVEDLATKKPMTPDSIHELASVSKQFTAAAILLLKQDGKLRLSDRLSKYFPSKNKNWDGISLQHLLNHTSGLPDYLETAQPHLEYSIPQLIGMIRQRPLVSAPGTTWAYSNSGYMVLGAIVEMVSKQKLAAFLTRRIFTPLAMKHSFGNDPFSQRISNGYSKKDGKVVVQGTTSRSMSLTGDGEVMSSAADLAKWEASFYGEKILDADSNVAMFQPCEVPMRPGEPNSPRYGMGWIIGEGNGSKFMNHSGGWMGTSTVIHRDLKYKTCFIVLCNADFVQAQTFLPPLVDRFLK